MYLRGQYFKTKCHTLSTGVYTPAPSSGAGGGGAAGCDRGPHPLQISGCHCGLWCRNSANFLIYN